MNLRPTTYDLRPKLILALDVDTCQEARHWVKLLYPEVKIFKVGLQLFTACGPKIIEFIRKKGAEVFLDLKFHDIPNTAACATRQAARLKVKMLTLHTSGGLEMLKKSACAAREEAKKLRVKPPLLLGVTVLTSDSKTENTAAVVLARACLAKEAGLDGAVCSVDEAAIVRKACGRDFIIVTPGIRPKGASAGDQKRIATASAAVSSGANYLVVGRPILEAEDPLRAARELW